MLEVLRIAVGTHFISESFNTEDWNLQVCDKTYTGLQIECV